MITFQQGNDLFQVNKNLASPTFADIDGDGDLDAVVGQNDGLVSVFLNDGTTTTPSFTEQVGAANPFNTYNTFVDGLGVFPTNAREPFTVSMPALADIDGDGDLDAFIGTLGDGDNPVGTDSSVRFFRNNGTAMMPMFVRDTAANPLDLADLGAAAYASPTFADIDGDGDLDALVGIRSTAGSTTGNTIFYENQGNNTTPTFVQNDAANPFQGVNIAAGAEVRVVPTFADADMDGDLDAFLGETNPVGGGSGTVRFFENRGTANNAMLFEVTGADNPFNDLNGTAALEQVAPAFADLNGDGFPDAIFGSRLPSTIRFFANTTNQTPPPPP
ncbi:VCBS repeat-containing protein, partial [Lusitaniella coriacea LEGE 07157]